MIYENQPAAVNPPTRMTASRKNAAAASSKMPTIASSTDGSADGWAAGGGDRAGWAEGAGATLESLTVTPMHGAMYKEAGVDDAIAPPPAAEFTALTGPKRGPDSDVDYGINVKD